MSARPKGTRVALSMLAAAAIMGLSLVGASADETRSRTETRPYTMGDVGPLVGMTSSVNFGPATGEHVVIRVEDRSGRAVGGVAMIRDPGSGDVRVYRTF